MNQLKSLDWEAIAGITAAVIALVLHVLHVAEEGVLLAVALVILALILLRDLRREAREDRDAEVWRQVQAELRRMGESLHPADALLVGPRGLREASAQFARGARGEMVWFNVCLLMFVPEGLFDTLLRPAIENPAVTSVQFILDQRERERWENDVKPKVALCDGRGKVREPLWRVLNEASAFILAETERGTEAHLSFWGEPFMSRTQGGDLPRYVFHVQPHSELISRLDEMSRQHHLSSQRTT